MALYNAPLVRPAHREPSRVMISLAAGYHERLAPLVTQAVREFGLHIRGKSVLLKPDFSSYDPLCLINTHPAVVHAARETFLRLGARSVLVADAPATERDTEAILESMDLRQFIGPLDENFVDLNFDTLHEVPLRTHNSSLRKLWLPETLLTADIVVSMPRMKIDAQSGVALSLKNMLGVVPGSFYGWPRSILHRAGDGVLLDVNATVLPDFVIVDAVIGMEGNGPLHGEPQPSGLLIMGRDPVAVDATCVRVMGLLPERIDHLRRAARNLGHITERRIVQLGERIATVSSSYVVPEFLSYLRPGSPARWLRRGTPVAQQ